MISHIFNLIFFEPLYNALIFLVGILPFHDIGLAIIILTLIVRLILFPFTHKSVVTQRKMKEIAPELAKIKEKFKSDKGEQAKQTMALYKSHGISPFSGFFMLLLQFPVLIALFLVLRGGIQLRPDDIYSFINFPDSFKTLFLGILDVSKPSYIMAILAGITQFIQIHLSSPSVPKMKSSLGKQSFGEQFQQSMAIQTKYIMPIIITFIAFRFSAGLTLYWTTSNVFAILHEIIVAKKAKKNHE